MQKEDDHQSSGSDLGGVCRKFKPHMLMISCQVGYTLLYFITEASFNHGMNPHVYITYRHVVSGVVMLPFAHFLERCNYYYYLPKKKFFGAHFYLSSVWRKQRPKLTFILLGEIFILSLLGVGLTLNTYFASMRYTSPTFISSMVNTIAALTFIIAVVLRLEIINLRNPRGTAKVLGTLISLAGVTTMTLYKGPIVRNVLQPLIRIQGNSGPHEDWLKGSLLTVSSCITWSIWYIMQAFTLRRYPAQLSLTTWMSFIGAAQSAVFTAFVEHRPTAWTIGLNIDLWSILYGGIVCSGMIIFIQLWCTEEKGPVFVTMFNPVSTILVAILAYFVLGESLYTGSILGAAIVIVGLYLLLWGKEVDEKVGINSEEPKDNNTQKIHSGDALNGEP